MRTLDFAPLYRSTVGFDQLFEMLDSSVRPDWPPYDIQKVAEDRYRIVMAVAGFATEDIELTQQGSSLLVVGEKKAGKEERQLLYKGIADQSFCKASISLTTSGWPAPLSRTVCWQSTSSGKCRSSSSRIGSRLVPARREWLRWPPSRSTSRPRSTSSIS
jgi:hypothetical protein